MDIKDLAGISEPIINKCSLCQKTVDDGVFLSNGSSLHEECMSELKTGYDDKLLEFSELKEKIQNIRRELQKREGIGFKILSVFNKPKVKTSTIESSIPKITQNISDIKTEISDLKSTLTSIYNLFLSYPPDWEDRKQKVLDRDGRYCSRCSSSSKLHLHHIKYLSKGGDNQISNLKLLCESCHSKEHGGRDFSQTFDQAESAFTKRVFNIRHAIDNNLRIKFGYKKPSDSAYEQRVVTPSELVNRAHQRNSGSTLCVSGYCELREENRIFALKRMRGLKIM